MSTYDPSGLAVMGKANGQILYAEDLKELVNLETRQFNGKIGNVNISSLPGEKIAASKLDLDGAITDDDIVSVSVSKFSSLKVSAQSSPNNTLAVAAGTFIKSTGLGVFSYAGGNSPTFPLPGVSTNRIDVLVIDDAGTLTRVAGVEAASPVAPDYPINKVPLAEIYVRYNAGGVVIRDTDNSVDSYIKVDARPFFRTVEIPDGTITGVKLVDYTIGIKKLNYREQESAHLSNSLGITFNPRQIRSKACPNADAQPCGNGVVRNGKVYFACLNRDYVVEWDHVADTITSIALTSGDHPGGLVKIGSDIYAICNDAYKIRKINSSNVVSQAVDLMTEGIASAAWTLVNALIVSNDGLTLYTLAKVAGTHVSQLLRVKLDGTGVTHAYNTVAGDSLSVPAYVRKSNGVDSVVAFYDDNPFTGNTAIHRRLASDLSADGTVTVQASASVVTPYGCDGQFYYVFDNTAGANKVRVFDVVSATMAEVAQFTLGGSVPAGAPNEVSAANRLFRANSGNRNQYPYFDGRQMLLPALEAAGPQGTMTTIPVPNWFGGTQVRIASGAGSPALYGFASDGEYIFAAFGNSGNTVAQIVRILG